MSDGPEDMLPEAATTWPGTTLGLVRAARAGSEAAFAALHDLHVGAVHRAAALLMGKTLLTCHDDIEDVAQETFLCAFEALRNGEFDEQSGPGQFRRWLRTILLNRIRTRARGRSALKRGGAAQGRSSHPATGGLESVATTGPGPGTRAGAREVEDRIERAILELPEDQRTALVLRVFEAASAARIAEDLGLNTTSTARALVHLARTRLRRSLRSCLEGYELYFAAIERGIAPIPG